MTRELRNLRNNSCNSVSKAWWLLPLPSLMWQGKDHDQIHLPGLDPDTPYVPDYLHSSLTVGIGRMVDVGMLAHSPVWVTVEFFVSQLRGAGRLAGTLCLSWEGPGDWPAPCALRRRHLFCVRMMKVCLLMVDDSLLLWNTITAAVPWCWTVWQT